MNDEEKLLDRPTELGSGEERSHVVASTAAKIKDKPPAAGHDLTPGLVPTEIRTQPQPKRNPSI
jgi:hypothetical protein